jgi:streptogrisin C
MKRIAVLTHTRTLLALVAASAFLAALAGALVPAAPASPQYPAPYVSPLLAAETEALTRQGISTERATQAIQVQSELAQTDLIRRIEAALGSAYAGVWFEPTTAQLHVGVISPAARHTAEATAAEARLSSQVLETPVASTWTQLLSTENRWSARLARLAGPVKLALAPQLNAVIVTLSTTLPTTQLTALEHEAAAATVTVHITAEPPQQIEPRLDRTGQCKAFVKKAAFCEKPIASGVTITNPFSGSTCTSGPLAIGRGRESNKTYVLTAGHCIVAPGILELFFSTTPAGAENIIGPATAAVAGNGQNGDYGSIEVTPPTAGFWAEAGNTPVFALTAEWKLTGGSTISYPVKGERTPVPGLTNCHEGQTTGQTCGEIKALSLLINYEKGLKVAGLVEDKGASDEAGDSGGPWLFIESNNEVLMEGIHSGGFRGNGTKAYYTPLQTALKALNLELLTTRNEVRKLFVADDAPVKINGTSKGSPVFETGSGGVVECESASSTATAAESLTQTLDNTITYAKCFAKILLIKFSATVSQAEALFEIGGRLSIENKITIKIPEGKCEVIIPSASNKELGTVAYTNIGKSPKEVEVKAAIEGLTQETIGSSEICGKSGKAGKYKGTMIEKAEEGDIEADS